MEDIRIITDKDELEGTCYIEVLPGPYKNQCWNDDSLFFDEEVFGYIEPIIERQVAAYDHYAFTEIEKERWFAIADDLEKLASALTSAESVSDLNDNVGFVFKGTDERFAATFDENKTALVQLFTKFSAWVRAQVNQYGSITILGI
jgi:hypothetical protein